MIVYEFYVRNSLKRYDLTGILPERRKDLRRINKESIRKWGSKIIGNGINHKDLFYTHAVIDRTTGRAIFCTCLNCVG